MPELLVGPRADRSAVPFGGPLLAIVGILAFLSIGGCVSAGVRSAPYATVVVVNDGTLTVNVYALRQGSRMRLGTVTSLDRAEFPLRSTMLNGLNELQLLIDPIGSRRAYPAQPINVQEGDVIELKVSSFIR